MPNERIITIKGDKSNWYEQAIFIVKKNVPQNIDFVAEAEKIISNYIYKNDNGSHTKLVSTKSNIKTTPSKTFDLVLNTIMLLSLIFITTLILYKFY